jgi:hypothetical protein
MENNIGGKMNGEHFDSAQQNYTSSRARGQQALVAVQDRTKATRNVVTNPGYADSMSSLRFLDQLGRKDMSKEKMKSSKRLKFVSAGDEL